MTETLATTANNPERQTPDIWTEAYPQLLALQIGATPAARADQLAVADGKGLVNILTAVHTAVAPDQSHVPSSVARSINSSSGEQWELMQPDERAPLMEHAASLIRELANKRAGQQDNSNFLRRSANVLALSTVLTHHFVDGNGRSARTLAQLTREGLDPNDLESVSDMKLVSANRTMGGFRINSFLPTKDGLHLTPTQLLDVAAALEVPLQDHNAYQQLATNNFSSPYPD